ncbi:hypothetical protein QJS04_geneDACA007997 [Acorus gramineus]|uniref:glycerophosphodiester phosphodiesterase n=1 Tax=Acorus gramineus TaxID=55184 RepID=A0AAV9BC53_ACOGR|nr:hypothetical protein QJS04_geneDACA007997 [Acorus gramineus]
MFNEVHARKHQRERAIEEGADFTETDIPATKDGELICLHDVTLDATTDVADHPEFADRRTTFEVKWADGKKYEDKFIETLKKYGYKGSYLSKDWLKQPLFIHSFMPTSLVYTSGLIDLQQMYDEITSCAYLDYINKYIVGIGQWKDTVVPPKDRHLTTPTDLIAKAHSCDLQVHPYTYQNEDLYLSFDFNQDPYVEYKFWIDKLRVNGVFMDFTGSLHRFQE